MTDFTDPKAVWNQRFSTPDYLFGEEPNAFLASQAKRLRHGRALALADGEGHLMFAHEGLQCFATGHGL